MHTGHTAMRVRPQLVTELSDLFFVHPIYPPSKASLFHHFEWHLCCGWRFVYVPQPSHPEPSDSASQKIVGKVRPSEGSTQKRPTDKGAADEFQKGRMPQLQEFQRTGHHQHRCSDHPGPGVVQEQEEDEAGSSLLPSCKSRGGEEGQKKIP